MGDCTDFVLIFSRFPSQAPRKVTCLWHPRGVESIDLCVVFFGPGEISVCLQCDVIHEAFQYLQLVAIVTPKLISEIRITSIRGPKDWEFHSFS